MEISSALPFDRLHKLCLVLGISLMVAAALAMDFKFSQASASIRDASAKGVVAQYHNDRVRDYLKRLESVDSEKKLWTEEQRNELSDRRDKANLAFLELANATQESERAHTRVSAECGVFVTIMYSGLALFIFGFVVWLSEDKTSKKEETQKG